MTTEQSKELTKELSKLTVAELRSLASELEIKGRSKMKKAELVDAVARARGAERVAPDTPAAPETPTPPRASSPEKPIAAASRGSGGDAASAGGAAATRRPVHREAPRPEEEAGASAGNLGLLVVDPTCVFVFWEVDEAVIARARDCVGDPQGALVLRIYGVAEPESAASASVRGRFDLFVESARGEQYLKVANPGQSLSCEMGVESHDGRFHVFAWSNRLDLPADRQPPAGSIRRMRIGGGPSRHWHARSVVRPSPSESLVVAAEAALPTDAEEAALPVAVGSDTVAPPDDFAALFESVEFTVSASSQESARRLRRGLFSGALGVSSSAAPVTSDRPASRAGEPAGPARPTITLPGLIASESGTD